MPFYTQTEDRTPILVNAEAGRKRTVSSGSSSGLSASFKAQTPLDIPIVVNGADKWHKLHKDVKAWAMAQYDLCQPKDMHVMTGSEKEKVAIKRQLVEAGVMIPLPKYDNCFLTRTDPKDVARVESKTFISTPEKMETVPEPADGVKGTLGNWISPEDLDEKVRELYPGCMKGRTMYLIPFSMGPVGGPLSKNGVELTDSAYVAASMEVMTRVGDAVTHSINQSGGEFVKCLHSVGQPLEEGEKSALWPCNPEKTIIAHRPYSNEIISFGSGYGGNSLLGKKCFALRLGSAMASKQGWLAEHMLIMGVKAPDSDKRRYICAAFPSACGKTNLAMLSPKLEGYDVTCVGDDIAWLRFDDNGELRAINPENGFFGVAPGTSESSNPIAMATIFKDTLFTNVAMTDDGGVWWEGMSDDLPEHLVDWKGADWTPDCGRKAAHPNSRFCAPAENCPIIDEAWEDQEGVKIDAILFGGRRPEGVPLIYEARDWQHGVFLGASLKSEATAAAEHKGKMVMHDPFSMRPFFGYNFGDYLKHWFSLGQTHGAAGNLPRMFMVNWFRKSPAGKFLWPGFGENIRVLDWVLRRCDGFEDIAAPSPLGYVPQEGAIKMQGLDESAIDWSTLFSAPRDFWLDEVKELRQYFDQQVGASLPREIEDELDSLEKRVREAAQ